MDDFEVNRIEWFSVVYAPLLVMLDGFGPAVWLLLTIVVGSVVMMVKGWKYVPH